MIKTDEQLLDRLYIEIERNTNQEEIEQLRRMIVNLERKTKKVRSIWSDGNDSDET